MSHQLTPVAWAIGLACIAGSFSTPVQAQQPQATSSDMEVIQVSGIRSSVVRSMNTKRYANAVVDAVTAEDIGKFPDQNVAESLQRITGVSITRSYGEGERVSIRGTPESQTGRCSTAAVGSADWWTNSAPSRGFNYTMLPSEILGWKCINRQKPT